MGDALDEVMRDAVVLAANPGKWGRWEGELKVCLDTWKLCRPEENVSKATVDRMIKATGPRVNSFLRKWVEKGDFTSVEKLMGAFLDNFEVLDRDIVGVVYLEANKVRDRMQDGSVMDRLALKLEELG